MSEQLRDFERSDPAPTTGVVGNRFLKTSIQRAKHLYDQYRFSGLMAKTEMLLDLTHKIRSDDGVVGFDIPHHNGRVTVSRHIYNTTTPSLEIAASWDTGLESGEATKLSASWDFGTGDVADLTVERQIFSDGQVVSGGRFSTECLQPAHSEKPNTLSVAQANTDVGSLMRWITDEVTRRREAALDL